MSWLSLFLRTWSQGLQGFVPIAVFLVWFVPRNTAIASAIRWGIVISIPVTVIASLAFHRSTAQAANEALLALCASVVAFVFTRVVWRERAFASGAQSTRPGLIALAAIAAAAVLIIVRQTMEIGSVIELAVVEVQSLPATTAVLSGALVSAGVALLCRWAGSRLPLGESRVAAKAFAIVFLAQVLIYAVHESSEAGFLPWSDILHTATEPYGPDGIYGSHLSELLVILPVVAVVVGFMRRRSAAVVALSVLLMTAGSWRTLEASAQPDEGDSAGRPHVVFRDTSQGANFGMLSVAPLDAPERERTNLGLSCARVAFAAGAGLCVNPVKGFFGLFTGHRAVFLDSELKAKGAPIDLEGKPSRSRVSPDGRLGAVTVFVVGDDYGAAFSTRTTLFDMRSGAAIGDLEQFATVRNGQPFRAEDFNFWGVTFARDSNVFYASLRTGGATYLVRGDVSRRQLTVLRDNVECPSLSPDNRLLAFKKRVGPDSRAWRLTVLDLGTMQEHLVAGETRYVDDQVEWLDSGRLLYAVRRPTTSIADVWVASIDGDAKPRIFLSQAESPIVVR